MSNDEPKFTYTKEEIRAATADMASTAAQHAVVREDAARNPPPTYRAATTNERQRDRVDTARLEALRAQQEALAAEAKAHQWEHKGPIAGDAASPRLEQLARERRAAERTFTREEVLTVLKAKKAEITAMANPLEVLAHLLGIFERME